MGHYLFWSVSSEIENFAITTYYKPTFTGLLLDSISFWHFSYKYLIGVKPMKSDRVFLYYELFLNYIISSTS